jgi:hypothetical protein
MSYLCWLCLSLPLGICRRSHVFFLLVVFVFTSMQTQPTQIRHVPSYKHLEVKTNTTKTNKTCALLQTHRCKDKHNQHK